MYSMVVLMALSTSVDTPDIGRRGGRGCHGCSSGGCYSGSCYSGGYGGGCYGGGCYGGGGYGGGCYGGACYGMPGGGGGGGYGPMQKEDKKDDKKKAEGNAPATFVVTLPENARLIIDDYVTKSTSSRRVFVSPPLTPGKTFVYTLKAEIMRDNKPVSVTREIRFEAGSETSVTLEFPAASVASK